MTNVNNNKWIVVVVVNDRGPSAKGRELDLSKIAFQEITNKKSLGQLTVDIEIITE